MPRVAAKEDAFAEASRLKNQFRALDADEAEFLDSVLERTRQEEDAIKAQTKEGLEAFRKRQEELDLKAKSLETAQDGDDEKHGEEEALFTVKAKAKRKRAKEKEVLKGVKIRRISSSFDEDGNAAKEEAAGDETGNKKHVPTAKDGEGSVDQQLEGKQVLEKPVPAKVEVKPIPAKGGLGLVDYGSDDDDDD